MNPIAVGALTALFKTIYGHRVGRFERALAAPELVQAETLRRILAACASTEYGRMHGVRARMTLEEFRRFVPVVDYADLASWIESQIASKLPILTPGRTRIYEPTSGSRGPRKLIPYNDAQLKAFSDMFTLWALDLLRSGLKLETGKVFFLISMHSNGGMRDDRDYLKGFTRTLSSRFFIDTSFLVTSDNFILDLADRLLHEPDLEVISVWSPSLLLLVMEHLRADPKQIWPKLKLISCWDLGNAKADAERLRGLFPGVRVQGKGLLATEGAMTLPWMGLQVPLLQDLFFEFENERTGEVATLGELETGAVYRIVFSAPNGFLRYRIGDRVKMGSRLFATPSLEFVGREGTVSDLVGEKLNGAFVDDGLRSLAANGFYLLLPYRNRYFLCAENPNEKLRDELEAHLMTQYHYALARKLGQLEPLELLVDREVRAKYFAHCAAQGMSFGQIKACGLIADQSLALKLVTGRQSRTEGIPTLPASP